MSRLMGVVICTLAFSLSGCGEQDEPAANALTSRRVPDDNLFKEKLRALDKAEDMQKTLNEVSARQQEVIEE